MRTPKSRSVKIVACSCCFLSLASSGFAADFILQKVPPLTVEQAPAYPQNLARYNLGAQIEATPQSGPAVNVQSSSKAENRNGTEATLLSDDPTMGYALPNGTTTLVISLPRIESIDTVSFLNEGTKGSVNVATSNARLPMDSPQWHHAEQQDLSQDAVRIKTGPDEAKYLRITFNVAEPGRISGFGVYSASAVSDFTVPRPRTAKVANTAQTLAWIASNLTDLHARARALYVSSGTDIKEANNMIDAQPSTAYSFAASDASPITIIDLGKESKLHRLSAIYSPQQGRMEFYVLQTLPGGAALPNSYTLSDASVASMKTVGSVTNGGEEGRASVDFPETSGRYVMIKWNPSSHSDGSFSVAEIAAFGGSNAVDETIADGGRFQGTQVVEGKNVVESKDVPAEGPPELPPDLPPPVPFTFIPEVSP